MNELVEKILSGEHAERPRSQPSSRLIFETNPIATLVFAADGQVLEANPAAHQMFRCEPPGLAGVAVTELLPELWRGPGRFPPDAARLEPLRRVSCRRRDTSSFAARVRLVRLGNAPDSGFLATLEDLTEIDRAALERARIAAIVENTDDAIIGTTLDGVVTTWNRGAERLFGYSALEVIGHCIPEAFPDHRTAEQERDNLRRVAAGESISHWETQRRRKDGGLVDVSVTQSPIRDFAGEILGVSEILRDITERKRAEQAIRELNASLETQVAERTAELAAANKELEAFTSAAAHDLRAPLRILNGFTEALQEECGETLSPDGRSFLGEILKASERMEGLIDGLLALSRCSRAELSYERLDITTLADLVLYELRHAQNTRSIECEVQPGLVGWGDVRLIMTTLRNLIGNAWKYTGHTDAPVIRIYGEQRDGRNWICVGDNGAGFDMQYGERLFKPFTRLHRQDEFPGHGIGLATVKRIVQRHGGDIAAEGRPGAGATFRFWLQPEPD